MDLSEGKHQFIQAWGTLGTSWGINKAMAQIHAVLLLAEKPLSTEDIMEALQISRGNANMNVRNLMDWGIVNKVLVPGERKEYFATGKDIWALARQVTVERKKREIEPILKVLGQMKNVEGEESEALEEFRQVTKDIEDFTIKVDNVLDKFYKSDKNWFLKLLMKM